MMEYTVGHGDTLTKISTYYGVSEEAIVAANPFLTQQPLTVGMTLIIPISREFQEFLREARPR